MREARTGPGVRLTRKGYKMSKVTLVYGLAKDATERWQEDLLATRCKNAEDVAKVEQAAARDGYHSFRTAEYTEGERPDFLKAIAI